MSSLPQPGHLIAGKYRVEQLLGEGGMGAVFGARNLRLDKPVALKWLKPELASSDAAKARFLREARASARIQHAHVVDVYDVGIDETSGAAFLVMERLAGETFAERLEGPALSPSELLHWLIPVARALSVAHGLGIVHRDVKPENLLVCHPQDPGQSPVVKLLDFGISKVVDDLSSTTGPLTGTGMTLGTPAYMSPEQLRGDSDIDQRADVYAFGVLLYRALASDPPYAGASPGAVAMSIATQTPRPLRERRDDLLPGLSEVVARAMARHREDRFASAEALAEALTACLASAPEAPIETLSVKPTTAPVDDEATVPRAAVAMQKPQGHDPGPAPPASGAALGAVSMGRPALWWSLAALVGVGLGLVWWWLEADRAASAPTGAQATLAAETNAQQADSVPPVSAAAVNDRPMSSGSLPSTGPLAAPRTDARVRERDAGASPEPFRSQAREPVAPRGEPETRSIRSVRSPRSPARGRRPIGSSSTRIRSQSERVDALEGAEASGPAVEGAAHPAPVPATAATPGPAPAPDPAPAGPHRSGTLRPDEY